MNITTLGIDLAKNVFHVHGEDARGKVVIKKRLSRKKLLDFVENLPPCLVGMEQSRTRTVNQIHGLLTKHGIVVGR